MICVDTSVIVAGAVRSNDSHVACRELLVRLSNGREAWMCGAHTLVEVYSVLTRFPKPERISPAAAMQTIDQIAVKARIVALTSEEQIRVLRECSRLGLASGAVHDAGLMACAIKGGAKTLYTLNPRHFIMAAPERAAMVRVPQRQ